MLRKYLVLSHNDNLRSPKGYSVGVGTVFIKENSKGLIYNDSLEVIIGFDNNNFL